MKTQHDLARLDDMLSTSMLVLDGDACWRPATSDTSDGVEETIRSVAGGSSPPCIPIENQPPQVHAQDGSHVSMREQVPGAV